jgi:hypothetical protein
MDSMIKIKMAGKAFPATDSIKLSINYSADYP